MKKNRSLSVAKVGMSRDMATDSLKNQHYTHALNMNLENESGDLFKLKSEHSNLLASKFKTGYKVVGKKTDITLGDTYFFLTNPTTKESEFGVIKNNSNFDLASDIESECKDCEYKNILQEPLESTTQVPYLTYTTLLEDSCNLGLNLCLNFNILYPIKKIVIKNEKSGVKIFFTDNLNPPRYIDTNRLEEYKYTGEIVCGIDETTPTCLACDKLRMFPLYTPIKIEPNEIVLGGSSLLGQYSFYAAYCDSQGNELSEYGSLTNPIDIFDNNNKILLEDEETKPTNYAIKLSVDSIDKDFAYYKVVVSYTNIADRGTSHYEVGVFPSITEDILFTTLQDKKKITLSEILVVNPNITLLEGVTEANNYLFGYGITKEKEWNLQPIVNLLGGFFKWQTHIAKENLYADGVNNALYKTFMRDETYPLSIKFETNTGYKTARFPLIGRPSIVTDLETIDNLDSESITSNINDCSSSDRNIRWKVYNTSNVQGTCGGEEITVDLIAADTNYEIATIGDTDFTLIGASENTVGITFTATGAGIGTGTVFISIPTNTVLETITKVCQIDRVGDDVDAVNLSNGITYTILSIGTTDFTLVGALTNTVGEIFVATGAGSGTGTTRKATAPSGSFIIDDPIEFTGLEDYINDKLENGECVTEPFCQFIDPNLYPDCSPDFGECGVPSEPDLEFLQVNTITGQGSDGAEKIITTFVDFPDDYNKLSARDTCYPNKKDSDGKEVEDEEFTDEYIGSQCGFLNSKYFRSYERISLSYNSTPSYAEKLVFLDTLTSTLNISYVTDYESFSSLVKAQKTNFTGTEEFSWNITQCDVAYFTEFSHATGVWFKVADFTLETSFIFEVTKIIPDSVKYSMTSLVPYARINIFDNKSSGAAIYSKVIDISSTGSQLLFEINNSDTIAGEFIPLTTYTILELGDTDFTLIGAATNTVGEIFVSTDVGEGTGVARADSYLIKEDGSDPNPITPFPTVPPKGFYMQIDMPIVEARGTKKGGVEEITVDLIQVGKEYEIATLGDTDFTLIGASANTVGEVFTATVAGIGTGTVFFTTEDSYYSVPVKGCFGATVRPLQVDYVEVFYDSIVFDKIQRYVNDCEIEVPIVSDCGALPYKWGDFGYTQSLEIYPDNSELYNSSNLLIQDVDFSTPELKQEFNDLYTEGLDIDGNYILVDNPLEPKNSNFICQPIRHFKFPDNKVSPFMYENQQAGFVNTIIYPLGVTINEKVINDFLNIAVNNELITQTQRESIIGYEIFRGDRTLHKSIIAKGLLYDMYSYTEKNKNILFSNFPYNALGENQMFYKDSTKAEFIPHPFGSDENYNFSFHSPDTDFYKPALPSELSIEGYTFGSSRGVFEEVKDHPKYVILGSKAKNLAKKLATIEVIAELIVAVATAASRAQIQIGAVVNVGIPSIIAAAIIGITLGVSGAIYKYGRFKYEWLKTFRDLGSPENFAYYYTSVGEYNYLKPLQEEGDSVRAIQKAAYLGAGRYTVINEVGGEKHEVNNVDREKTLFLTLGSEFPINYPIGYKTHDNVDGNQDLSSRFVASGTYDCTKGRSEEFFKNIASPYVSLKNYLPSQYGKIDNIKWLTTSYSGDLDKPKSSCLAIFGGDTFIARHTLKRKIPLFLDSAMGLASLTPYNYRAYSNLGEYPTFYANFNSPDKVTIDRSMPDISSEYEFDCLTGGREFYITQPSKFYLYYYGIPSFLTETSINLNYRTARSRPVDGFYPLVGDYVEWTQERVVSIKEQNKYYYHGAYSGNTRVSIGRTLPATYDKEIFDKLYDAPNGVVYSLPDNSENSLTEPWLTFKPLDRYEFSTSFGKLKELRGIETEKILGRFEHKTAIFNAVDVLVDGVTPDTASLGNGGIFARRPVTFYDTDLGYAGTQTSDMVSNEYGHFFVDANRGQVFKVLPSGKGMEEISASINNQPSGMKNWFKEHLPFKIKNKLVTDFENVDIDNPYNGIGIVMGWDSRYKRVFITKRDYTPLKPVVAACRGFYNPEGYDTIISEYEGNGYTFEGFEDCRLRFTKLEEVEYEPMTEIDLCNVEYFQDASFTIAYSMTSNSWMSFYDFKPNYYVNHNNYFQTGMNVCNTDEFWLWSHLLTNKSYGVFYGKKYEIGLEFPTVNNFSSKELESMELWTEGLRYHNEYDFAYNRDINFNKMVVFNHRESSGELRLVPQKMLSDIRRYPKTVGKHQEILATNVNDRWNVNYIYNRSISENLNQPLWNWDSNQINKSVNNKVVKFKGKKVLERLRGDFFLTYLGYDTDSRYAMSFKWAVTDENNR